MFVKSLNIISGENVKSSVVSICSGGSRHWLRARLAFWKSSFMRFAVGYRVLLLVIPESILYLLLFKLALQFCYLFLQVVNLRQFGNVNEQYKQS